MKNKILLTIAISAIFGGLSFTQSATAAVTVANGTRLTADDFHVTRAVAQPYDVKFPAIAAGGTYTFPDDFHLVKDPTTKAGLDRLITDAYWTSKGTKIGDGVTITETDKTGKVIITFSNVTGGGTTPTSNVALVPEPEEWVMIMLGLPLIAWAARHKKGIEVLVA